MTRPFNLRDTPLEEAPQPPGGHRCARTRIGRAMGAELTGASVYERPPGAALRPSR